MSQLDPDFADIFKQNELRLTRQIVQFLSSHQINPPHLQEKTHLAINIIDQFCHELIYHQHSELDYQAMKSEVVKTISQLFRQ